MLFTGWSAGEDADVVVEHAVNHASADRHVAVCGTSLPVVDRRRPWVAEQGVCCQHCIHTLLTAVA